MDVITRMKEKEDMFEKLKKAIIERQNTIKSLNSEIDTIATEILKLQGELRLLIEIGKENGDLDENGETINKVQVVDEVEIMPCER